ncbi:helix-turn-helix domain-containing protein [Streptomyces sp. NPDC018031]|uniref:helix-turn-helix domain-containing protein n=1 Tax=Streptomyces sp. NPDC018031 TaxID=3365033 RepID=UPI0037BA7B0E
MPRPADEQGAPAPPSGAARRGVRRLPAAGVPVPAGPLGRTGPPPAPGGAERGTGPSGPAAAPAFAAVLREALRLRGLPLQRVCDRLAARGLQVSAATLSHWQRGRSLPERPQSLRAVRELEDILDVPPDHLVRLLQPQRPRGRARTGAVDLAASRQVFPPGSLEERALGAAFAHFNRDISPLSIHETVWLGPDRCIRRYSVTQVLRAVGDGPDRLTLVYAVDNDISPATDFTVHSGALGPVRFAESLRCVVADVLLGRRLARGETAVIRYDLRIPSGPLHSTHHERRLRTNLREYLLQVCFDAAAVPVSCHKYYRRRTDTEREQVARVVIDPSHTTHLFPGKCPAGVHGIFWEWPAEP